jgi:uncharacterized membrane protein YjgN (DUF898 family)
MPIIFGMHDVFGKHDAPVVSPQPHGPTTQAPTTPAPPAKGERPAAPHSARLVFDGTGSEYFRIWVVNMLLTVLTLGIYSAWAKVRKARWFAQHTALMGDRFDFHGDPVRILLGRVVAVVLLLLWTWSFQLAAWAGLAVLALMCAVGPLLFASAQRFRLVNTSWRGLRFGFDVPRTKVYAVCVPLLLLWTAGTVLEALKVSAGVYVVAALAGFVGFPWAHARLKGLQHNHATFAGTKFEYKPSTARFYGLYLKATLLLLLAALCAGMFAALVAGVVRSGNQAVSQTTGIVAAVFTGLFVWMCAWPYFAARLQQIVWERTWWAQLRFRGHMRGAKLWRLVMIQGALVLLTAGLYWPFAAVAIARYRINGVAVESYLEPLGELHTHSVRAEEQRAAGDGAADFFGLDLGW